MSTLPPHDKHRPAHTPIIKSGVLIVLLALAAFTAWATLAPLDEGVPAPGVVSIDTKRKTIQHLTGGVISKVHVKEGQQVRAGDALIDIDDGPAQADYLRARDRYIGLRLTEARLLAQKAGLGHIRFPADLAADAANPVLSKHMAIQTQLFNNERLALDSELAALDESIRSQRELATGYRQQLANRKEQLALLDEQLKGLRQLALEGYAPRNQVLEMERQRADIQAAQAQLLASLNQTQATIAEWQMRKQQKQQETLRNANALLAEIQKDIEADKSRLAAAKTQLARTQMTSPVAGAVVGLANQTVGGVIPPGARIMDIVPADEALLVEANVPPQHISRIKPQQLARVHFTTFSDQPQLSVEGKVLSVSADQLSNPATGLPYFLVRVQITEAGMQQLGQRKLQAGMPVELLIRTGERTLLAYMMQPLLGRLNQAMKEH